MSEKKDTFTLFGVELGTCRVIFYEFPATIEYWDFKANEIGKSLGLVDSWNLWVNYHTGDIHSFNCEIDEEMIKTKLNHTISLCMNVPVTGEVGE